MTRTIAILLLLFLTLPSAGASLRDVFFDHLRQSLPMIKERVIALNRDARIRMDNLNFDSAFYGIFGFIDGVYYKWLRYGRTYDFTDEIPVVQDVLLYGFVGEGLPHPG